MTIVDVSIVASLVYDTNPISSIMIMSHLNSFEDLELIILANKSVKEISNSIKVQLYIPYFLGARSDRKFGEGSVNYVKEVIAPIINSQGFDQVTVLDPHSDVLEACINHFRKVSNLNLVEFALDKIYGNSYKAEYSRFALVSPDGGSLKKIYDLAEALHYENQIVIAAKHRDLQTGKIMSTNVHLTDYQKSLDMIIVDDICDGGRTFVELSKALRAAGATGRIYLIITHGIFSAGLKALNPYFYEVFSTNSVVDMNDPQFSLMNDNELHKLQQLNVY
jgi:ribose-phosphate pyrophosphokinase